MSSRDFFRKSASSILKKFLLAVPQSLDSINSAKNVLVIRQHNQFGDMLASVSLFRAIKESLPGVRTTLLASPENYYAVTQNEFIDELFVFEKKNLINPEYYLRLKSLLKREYDLAIVPATVAVSATSNILAGLSKAKIKIGPRSLNGKINENAFVFTHAIDLNWKKCPDAHVSDFILDIVRPFGIKTKNYESSISFNDEDKQFANSFLKTLHGNGKLVVGFHVGAGKCQNKWSLEKFVELIERMKREIDFVFYFTGSRADNDEISFIRKHFGSQPGYFLDNTVPQLAALISRSDLFITNDTGIMHVAGATEVPQISLFGPTNPFNWAPVGHTKYFLRKSELIDDISVDDVYDLVKYIFEKHYK